MNRLLKIFIVTFIIILSVSTVAFAGNKRGITSVAVTGIEAPFSQNTKLDTEGNVERGSGYRITNLEWKTPVVSASGYYEVTITLETDNGFVFSGDVTGTVNGDGIAGKRIINEEKMTITYVFDNNSSTSNTINDATSTVRYRISVYCNTEKGQITPKIVRVLKGSNQTFKIIPEEGYKIKDVVVDDESVGPVSEYTFKKVKENHSIRAYFEKIEVIEDEEDIKNNETTEIKPLLNMLLELLNAFI